MIREYFGMPEATVEAFRNLWFHTGDRGRFDDDGFLYFIDRIKDCIRRRGENISSWEVEKVVNGHDAVNESAAYGVSSELSEEEVMVAVVLQPGATLGPEELLDHCQGRMAHFAVPRYVRFVDELPKTPSQRIQKFLLRADGVTQRHLGPRGGGLRSEALSVDDHADGRVVAGDVRDRIAGQRGQEEVGEDRGDLVRACGRRSAGTTGTSS